MLLVPIKFAAEYCLNLNFLRKNTTRCGLNVGAIFQTSASAKYLEI